MAQGFERLVGFVDRQIGMYNRDLAQRLDRLIALLVKGEAQKLTELFSPNASTPEGLTEKTAIPQAAYLLDIAKAEDLDQKGDNQNRVELLQRHVA